MRLRGTLLFCTLWIALFCLVPAFASASCPATGSRPIAGDERERAQRLGIRIEGNCVDQVTARWLDARIDEDIAFFYANNRICRGKGAGLPSDFNVNDTSPENWNRIRAGNGYVYFVSPSNTMNPGALRCFRRFFEQVEAMNNSNIKPCVSAALRSLAHQRASCYAPNSVVCGRGRGSGPRSCPTSLQSYANCPHVNGLAMDLGNNAGDVEAVLSLARQFSGFSRVGVTRADPWHVEARGCADPNFSPSLNVRDTWDGPDRSTVTRAPLGLGDLARNYFGQQPPMPPQPPLPPQAPLPPQPVSATQPITGAFTPSTGQASSPSQSQSQTNTQTQTNTNANLNTNVSESIVDTSTTSTSTSAADLLSQLAFGTSSATSSAAATSVPLVITGAQAGTIAYVEGELPPGQSTTSVGGIAPVGEQTFTSGYLSEQGFSATSFTPRETVFLRTLTALRATLYALLQYLTPFSAGYIVRGEDFGE